MADDLLDLVRQKIREDNLEVEVQAITELGTSPSGDRLFVTRVVEKNGKMWDMSTSTNFSYYSDVACRISYDIFTLFFEEKSNSDSSWKVLISSFPVISAPKNNDGRETCFWCAGEKTQKRGGGLYDICPKCGR